MITIQLPTALRGFTGGNADVLLDAATRGSSTIIICPGGNADVSPDAATVDTAIRQLAKQYPDLQRHLFDENDKLRSFVNVYLNDEDVRSFDGVNTEVKDGDVLMLIPAIAGGSC